MTDRGGNSFSDAARRPGGGRAVGPSRRMLPVDGGAVHDREPSSEPIEDATQRMGGVPPRVPVAVPRRRGVRGSSSLEVRLARSLPLVVSAERGARRRRVEVSFSRSALTAMGEASKMVDLSLAKSCCRSRSYPLTSPRRRTNPLRQHFREDTKRVPRIPCSFSSGVRHSGASVESILSLALQRRSSHVEQEGTGLCIGEPCRGRLCHALCGCGRGPMQGRQRHCEGFSPILR